MGSGVDTDPTCMSWAPNASSAWSDPVVVSPRPVTIDTNAAAVIHADGSVLGLWRDHNGVKLPKGQESRPHVFRATHWRQPQTYVWDTAPLFSTKDVPGALEDPTVWRSKTDGSYHALFHMNFDCRNCGGHAWSRNGTAWRWTGIAYTALTNYSDGTSVAFKACERPHVVTRRDGAPIALTNGVIEHGDSSFTLLRPIATSKHA